MEKDYHFTPALYVVATPIGNLGDITLRALALLHRADCVACEDTRHSRRLLKLGLDKKPELLSLHAHNENEAGLQVIRRVTSGKCVALISDAGTPGICDPGARVVAATIAAGLPVIPLPGACAAITAWSVSGWLDDEFTFVGFLPSSSKARRQALVRWAELPTSLIFYEAPHRIVATINDMSQLLTVPPALPRTLIIAREISKVFEDITRLPLNQAPAWIESDLNRQRGEFVLLLSAAKPDGQLSSNAKKTIDILLGELPLRQAVQLAAKICGESKNQLYKYALQLK